MLCNVVLPDSRLETEYSDSAVIDAIRCALSEVLNIAGCAGRVSWVEWWKSGGRASNGSRLRVMEVIKF